MVAGGHLEQRELQRGAGPKAGIPSPSYIEHCGAWHPLQTEGDLSVGAFARGAARWHSYQSSSGRLRKQVWRNDGW